MSDPSHLKDLLEFPGDHLFKAFGVNDDCFPQAVRAAVETVLPVPADAIKARPSSRGGYLCVSVLLRLHSYDQLQAIYKALRMVQGVKFLL